MKECTDDDDFTPESKETSGEEDVVRIRVVYSSKYYDVFVVKFDEMPAMTYAVINRDTQVIEATQPILHNAKLMARQFSAWMDEKEGSEGKSASIAEALRIMKGTPETH
jgi:hypothetical protein